MSSIDDLIFRTLETAPAADEESRRRVAERAANVLRPAGALARLDGIAHGSPRGSERRVRL